MGGGNPSYTFWYSMMENYSRRTLTFGKDKLAALAGIIEEFKGLIRDTPTMGLCQGDMLTGLLWRTAEPASRVDCPGVMPSWSWASVSGPVNWEHAVSAPPGTSPQNQLEVISVNIDWSGRPMTSQVLDAKLKVCGWLKKAKLSKWKVEGGNSFHLHEIDKSAKDSLEPLEVGPVKQTLAAQETLGYCYLEEPQPVNSHVWCLKVYSVSRQPQSDQPRNHVHKALVQVPVDDNLGKFRRVGVGDVWLQSFRDDGNMGSAVRETFKDIEKFAISII